MVIGGGRKLGRESAHRMSMLRTMAGQLIMHETIETTLPKAKELRPLVERLISLAKTGNLTCYRKAIDFLRTKTPARKLFTQLPERFADRAGGYCRITSLYPRVGDDATRARIEIINEPVEVSRARKQARNFLIRERLQWKKEYHFKQRHGLDL